MRRFTKRLAALLALAAAGAACVVVPNMVVAAAKPEQVGLMAGAGSIATGNVHASHGLRLRCDASDDRQNLEVTWDRGNKFQLADLTRARCVDRRIGRSDAGFDTFRGSGTGRHNGERGARIDFRFVDGDARDTAYIRIRDAGGTTVLEVRGRVRGGHHEAHRVPAY